MIRPKGVLHTTLVLFLAGCSSGDGPQPNAPASPATPVESPADPATPVVSKSAIEVQSEPAGASVFINGRLVGATPVTLPVLAPGTYSLRMERLGCAPHQRPLIVNGSTHVIHEALLPEPTGSLEVKVAPPGAEVLLNGELVGLTPLSLERIPVGVHEMTIRKTNFRPYTAIVRIQPGQTARFADRDPEHHLLKDLIIEMLDSLIQSEPHRASHYLDKGHYLFINNRMEEAAEAFAQAEEISLQPPVLAEGLSADEKAAELRLFSEDRKRVTRDIARHRSPRSFDFSAIRDFNLAFEKAKQRRLMENVGSWEWVSGKGRTLIGEAQYLQAIQLYEAHLEQVGNGETAVPCSIELMKVRLMLRDIASFRPVLEGVCRLTEGHPEELLTAVRAVLPYVDRLRSAQRPELLGLLETPLHKLLEQGPAPWKGESAALLGRMMILEGRAVDAVPFLETSVKEAVSDESRDEQSLQLAEALRLARRTEESKTWYARLAESPRESVSKRARAGLILLGVDHH